MSADPSLPPVVDWFINLVATYGLLPVIFVGSGLILTVWISLGALLDRAERQREQRRIPHAIHQLELFANDPDNHRRETP
ncbi:hypothetical protein [Streptomyces triticiradicis]|uniref:Uncharacterized protein n=1 Tax=Streptomyces triticiradicis TaxID=2651189 RepID=A0A7J5D513_9ACTN|nr:hypothetical protein [Streptomyces triticiradicis]KAB1979260.1 hypothetical protein F8144_36460 [Streptomyces triticiradicis]